MESKEAAVPNGSSTIDQFFKVTIDTGMTGMRLDQFLTYYIPTVSRTLINSSIKKGLVSVDDTCRKSSYRLKEGETVRGAIEKPQGLSGKILPEKIDFPILYEDDSLLLLSKPPGLVVHPGSGNYQGTLVNGLVHYCQSIGPVGDSMRPGIVHRLDKDTSGIMVVAKTDTVHRLLVETFKNRKVQKVYLALLHGVPAKKEGRIVAAIDRHPVQRQKMAVRSHGGRYAVSNWKITHEFENRFSLAEVTIETGRTHQIRVHMAHLGFPVAGDKVYGGGRGGNQFPRQMLHASRLVLRHPVTELMLDKSAALWPDFLDVLKGLGLSKSEGI